MSEDLKKLANPNCDYCLGQGERHNGYFSYPCSCVSLTPERISGMTNGEAEIYRIAINELFKPTGRNLFYLEPDKYICPQCKSDETFTINDFLERGIEYRECESCGCKYRVHFKTIVTKIEIENKNT